jgi:3-dehydroquinate synthase
MPTYAVETARHRYPCVVSRGAIAGLSEHLPHRTGKLFVVTEENIWRNQGGRVRSALSAHPFEVLYFAGGEDRKRMSSVEALAEQMVERGGDRSSLVIAFGGGVVGDLAGFLAAIFMRGVPVIQIPTTLLAQVDASVGGKTGANLVAGKNLIGAFHQPRAVLIDPDVLATLSGRQYRAGLYEVIKAGIIASPPLFDRMEVDAKAVLARDPAVAEEIIAESVRIKAEVVTADEREGDLRRILNFGHTLGHALEAETSYERLLHGEAVAFGMRAATHLSSIHGALCHEHRDRILHCLDQYGVLPDISDVPAENLVRRTGADKKTVHGKVHFVLAGRIGAARIVTGIPETAVLEAARRALSELAPVR